MGFFDRLFGGNNNKVIEQDSDSSFDRSKLIEYRNMGFTGLALHEIEKGLEKGVDVSVYAKHIFSHEQMNVLRKGLEDGLDVTPYAREEYSSGQMMELYIGLYRGIDITPYKNSVFTREQMKEIRLGIEENVDVSVYTHPSFSPDQMEQIREGLEAKDNASIYANPDFTPEQMEWLKDGLRYYADVRYYANPAFTCRQMEEIYKGLVRKLDVTTYAYTYFSADQMEQIRIGLEDKLKVVFYANPNFTWKQMEQIREGLKLKLDVSKYANPYYSCVQMEEIKTSLLREFDLTACDDDDDYAYKKKYSTRVDALGGESAERFIDDVLSKCTAVNFMVPEAIASIYNVDQLEEIRNGLISGVDINKFVNPKLSAEEMKEIRYREENALWLDPTKEVDYSYSIKGPNYEADNTPMVTVSGFTFSKVQRDEIFAGRDDHVDTFIYEDQQFTPLQMRVIREGLSNGKSFGWVYAQPDISAHRMQIAYRMLNNDVAICIPNPFTDVVGADNLNKTVDINELIERASSSASSAETESPVNSDPPRTSRVDDIINRIKSANASMGKK